MTRDNPRKPQKAPGGAGDIPEGKDTRQNSRAQETPSWEPVAFVLLSFPNGMRESEILQRSRKFLGKLGWRSQCHLWAHYGLEIEDANNSHIHLIVHTQSNEIDRWRRRTEDFQIEKAFKFYARMDRWDARYEKQGIRYVGTKHSPTHKANEVFNQVFCPRRGGCSSGCKVEKRLERDVIDSDAQDDDRGLNSKHSLDLSLVS